MRRRKGFTLIELTIALAVIVVAAGFLVLRVGGWTSRSALNSSARALGNTICLFRGKALAEERVYTLRFEGEGYRVETLGERGMIEVLRQVRLGPGQSMDGSPHAPLILGPRGILPPTSLTIRNDHGEKVTLGVGILANEITYRDSTNDRPPKAWGKE